MVSRWFVIDLIIRPGRYWSVWRQFGVWPWRHYVNLRDVIAARDAARKL